MQKNYILLLISCLFLGVVSADEDEAIIAWHSIFQPVRSDGGMVVSQEHHATHIGADILARGGNAIDAAVAMGFAEAVTLPKAGNLAGGGFMLIYLAAEKRTIAIDYREQAPSLATRDMFIDDNGNVDKDKIRFSTSAVGVPGTVAGLIYAHEKFGSLTRKSVINPAYQLAKNGFVVDHPFLDSLHQRKSWLIQDPEFKRIYFKSDTQNYQAGERLILSDLAWTLQKIIDNGKDGFYQGEVAKRIIDYVQATGSPMTLDDLKTYDVKIRQAIRGTYRGFDIISMPPPSSGGLHVIQALNILEGFNLTKAGWGSAAHIHILTETFRRIYADRSEHLGDPDFHNVPLEKIASKNYAKILAQGIAIDKASKSSEVKPSVFIHNESPQTTHYSVVDKWGNVVTNTYTLNFSFGNGKIVPGTGLILNNEMDDFSAKPGVPNAYGLIGGEANAIEGKKRPLSSMSPTIVLKQDQPVLITGSPGGSRIITAVIHQIVNYIDFNMNVAESVSSPRFHHQWYPDKLYFEKGFSPDTRKILLDYGHHIENINAYGSVQSIEYKDGFWYGASDPRRAGAKAMGIMKDGTLIEY